MEKGRGKGREKGKKEIKKKRKKTIVKAHSIAHNLWELSHLIYYYLNNCKLKKKKVKKRKKQGKEKKMYTIFQVENNHPIQREAVQSPPNMKNVFMGKWRGEGKRRVKSRERGERNKK